MSEGKVKVFKKLADAVEYAGWGIFNVRFWFMCGILLFFWAQGKFSISVLGPELKCTWFLTGFEVALITALQAVGIMIGGMTWGRVFDTFGRRHPLMLVYFFMAVFGSLGAAAPSYWWFVADRMAYGFFLSGFPQMNNLVMELTKVNMRSITNTSGQIFWAFGCFYFTLIAYIFMVPAGWRVYLLILHVPIFFAVILMFFLLPESFSYLLVKGRKEEAETQLTEMFEMNTKCPSVWLHEADAKGESGTAGTGTSESAPLVAKEKLVVEQEQQKSDAPAAQSVGFKDLFGSEYRWTTILTTTVVFVIQASYMGHMLVATELFHARRSGSKTQCTPEAIREHRNTSRCLAECSLKDEDYLNIVYTSLGEFVGAFPLAFVMSEYWGRRPTLATTLTVFGAGLISIIFFMNQGLVVLAILICTRTVITAGSTVQYMYMSEVYPTVVRGVGVGLAVTFVGVAQIFTPFVGQWLGALNVTYAIAVYGVMGVIGGVAAAFLPIETKGRALVETVQK
jgi:MFS family permease